MGRYVKASFFAVIFAAIQLFCLCPAYAEADAVSAVRAENSIEISVSIPDAEGYLTLMAVCPKQTVSDEYDTVIDDTGVIIGIETAEISGGAYSTVIPIGGDGPFGTYKIYVSYNGDKYMAECEYKKDAAEYKEELKNALNADGAAVMEVLKAYGDITLIDDEWISALPEEITGYFEDRVSAMLPVDNIDSFLEKMGSYRTVSAALNEINGAADAKAAAAILKKHTELFALAFDPTEAEAGEFMDEFYKKLPIYTDEPYMALNDTYILRRINESSWGAYGSLIEKYGYIGIDKTKDMSGMSKTAVDSVFQKLTLSAPFADIDGFKTKYAAALKEVKNSGSGSGKPSSGGSSGGGGGGRTASSSTATRGPVTATTEIAAGADTKKVTFTDLTDAEWSRESVEYLASLNVVSGVGDGRFAPLDTVKREEFLKTILNAFEFTVVSGRADFEDVDENSWYGNYVFTAYSSGLVTGISENEFGIGNNISRQDAAVMVKRALDGKKKALDITLSKRMPSDIEEVSDYARDAVGAMFKANVLSGDESGAFCPTNSLTRAEAAKIIYGVIKAVR